jgi:mycofactocin precursor
MDTTHDGVNDATCATDEPAILEEIEVEDLAVDGICGVY